MPRERIVEVSRAIVEDEGVEQLTIRRIAETIGRTQPAVYQQFASKDAILAAIAVDGFVALADRLERARRGQQAPLAAVASAYVRFGIDRPRLYDLIFVGPAVTAFAGGAETPAPAQTAFRLLADAVGASGMPPARVDTATEVVWACLHGFVMLSITGRLRPSRPLQRARLEQLIATVSAMTACG